ncbi:GNAT family N-acetyltransferase [Leucobacter sp. UT-8R-CII-1-4]|uniref:GNAT family N-acetyltransferase n=1 Tax=Leucobacter sp. UT-8R-CII-1-4 TaxID=3040075 RepID=UPI0024A9F8EC|nr:GNAT family N-acetyltransferase [Leucobacter sp. UT-8R-CII-1-4]MDI6023641.1 GNAT family N-acetyltransferase [Leucobacter sp. UT-8R-CII-1-4]
MSEAAAPPAPSIRAGVVPADVELCANIWTSALEARDGSVDRQTMGQRVRDAFENEIVHFGVATSPRQGFVFVETVPAEAGTALLHYLAVDPAGSGGGVGRALLADAIRHTKQAGFTRLLLEVRDVNSRAIELYTRQGFVALGEPVPHPTAGYPMQSYVLEFV